MHYEEVFSVGFDRSFGGCDYSVKCKNITRDDFNKLVSMTYYALAQLETQIVDKDALKESEEVISKLDMSPMPLEEYEKFMKEYSVILTEEVKQ